MQHRSLGAALRSQKSRAVLCILSSAFCFATMSVMIRLSGDISFIQKSFFRNIVAAIIAAAVLLRSRESFLPERRLLGGYVLRATLGTVGIFCNYYAVDHLLLADASAIQKLSPFFSILFSFLLLRERIKPAQLVAIAVAFCGSLLIIKPSFGGHESLFPAGISLLGAMCAGAAYVFVRFLTQRGARKTCIVFFFSAFSCLVTVPYLLTAYEPMTLQQLACLLGAGVFAAGGQFSVTAAYSLAPAKEISVFDYSQILFSALYGLLFFSQRPDALSVLGYFVVCGVAVALFRYNKRHEAAA